MAAWLVGGGEMGERIRSMDWSRTPLGALESWPPGLRTALGLCLASPVPMALAWGPQHVMLYNDSYRDLCGPRHPWALGQDFQRCWADTVPALSELLSGALAGRATSLGPQQLAPPPEGSREQPRFTCSYSPLRDEHGEVVGVLNTCVRASPSPLDPEPAHGGPEVVRRTDLYAVLINALATIAVLRGPEHVYDFVNTRYEALGPAARLLGRPVLEVFPELRGQEFVELMDRVYRDGQTLHGQELRVRLKREGQEALEERFFNYTYQPMRNDAGQVASILTALFEVTGWVKARQQAEQRAAELEAVLQSIPYGVYIADTTGHIRTNRAARDTLGVAGVEEALQRALRGQGSSREVHVHQGSTRQERIIQSTTAPARWREEIIGAVSINIDVTESKRADAERESLLASEQSARHEAEQANRMKDEFLARISHELATPALGMRLWLEMLEKNESKRTEALEALRQCMQAHSKIVHDLLDTERALNGKLSVQLEACEPGEPLTNAIAALRPMAEQNKISLTLEQWDTPLVRADPVRLQQVLSNLVSNAIKFTPAGGKVDVRLEPKLGGVCFTVSDTGRGYPPRFQPLLFAPFRQAEEGTTRSKGGLGLGLAIVRQLVELHGGKVWAHSAGPGQGATFTVWLPALAEEGEDAATQWLDPMERQLEGTRLLLVEDDPLTRTAVTSVLEQQGAEVRAVESAAAALELLRTAVPVDAVLCDIAMPGEDGYSFIRKMRALEPPANQLPAAAFTAHMGEQDRTHALLAGFQMHIPKSVEPFQLIAHVRTLVRGGPPGPSSPRRE